MIKIGLYVNLKILRICVMEEKAEIKTKNVLHLAQG